MGNQLVLVVFSIVTASPLIVQHIREIENIECDLKCVPSATCINKEILHQLDIKTVFERKPVAIPFNVFTPALLEIRLGIYESIQV